MGKEKSQPKQSKSLKIEFPSPPNGCPNIFNIDKKIVTIGRSETNDIVIPNSSISRNHMHLIFKDRILYAEDLNSKNGTFIKSGKKWQKIKGRQHITPPA
jgi:hypothetical protein